MKGRLEQRKLVYALNATENCMTEFIKAPSEM